MEENKTEVTYEEYVKILKDVFGKQPKLSKENYEKIEFVRKQEEEFKKKIDKLASEYYLDTLNKQYRGYYEILEYCFEKIKYSDEKLKEGRYFEKPEDIKENNNG